MAEPWRSHFLMIVLKRSLGVERLVAELARLRRGAGVDDRVAGAEAVAVLDHAVVGGEREVAVVGVPEELHLVEQDAVGLLGVEAVLLRAAHQEVPADEAVGAVAAKHDVLRVAGVLGAVRRVEAFLRAWCRRPRRAARSASWRSRSPCRRRGGRPRAWRRSPRSEGCTARTRRAPARGCRGGRDQAPARGSPSTSRPCT